MSNNETERQEHNANQKRAWRAEPKSAIPTAIARCIMGLATLAVGILAVQTIGAVSKYPEAVPDYIVNTAMGVMFLLLLLAAGLAVALFVMSKAVLIRNTPQAMADDYWTKRVEEKLRISEEQKGKLIEDNEKMKGEKSETDSKNGLLIEERDELTRQLLHAEGEISDLKTAKINAQSQIASLTQERDELSALLKAAQAEKRES